MKREMDDFLADDSEASSHDDGSMHDDGSEEEEMSWHGSESEVEKEGKEKGDLDGKPPASNAEEGLPLSSLLSWAERRSNRSRTEKPRREVIEIKFLPMTMDRRRKRYLRTEVSQG